VGLERGPLSFVRTIDELLGRKRAAPVKKADNTALGIRNAHDVAPSTKASTNFAEKRRWLGRYSSLADSGHGVQLVLANHNGGVMNSQVRIVHPPVFSLKLNSIGLSVPHRKHITSPLRAQQVYLSIPATGCGGLSGCEILTPHCLGNGLTDGGKVVSPAHRPRCTPQKHYSSASGTHFC
jgi:hypothetical protein